MADRLANLPISSLVVDPEQPRTEMERVNYLGGDANTLQGLADSIREVGVLQPIRVVAMDGDEESRRYMIVSGQRRFHAAHMAGLSQIPCVVTGAEIDGSQKLVAQVTENLQRKAMTSTELAMAIRSLVQAGSSQDEVAAKLGIQASQVSVLLKLLVLEEPVRKAFDSGRIESPRAAYDLNKLPAFIQQSLISRAEAKSQVITQRDVREARQQMADAVVTARHPYEPPLLSVDEYRAVRACLDDGVTDEYRPEPHRSTVFGPDWVGVERSMKGPQATGGRRAAELAPELPAVDAGFVRVPSFTLRSVQVERLYRLLNESPPQAEVEFAALGKALAKRLAEL